jgi:hypothetical protein
MDKSILSRARGTLEIRQITEKVFLKLSHVSVLGTPGVCGNAASIAFFMLVTGAMICSAMWKSGRLSISADLPNQYQGR